MSSTKLKEYLDQENVKYTTINHSTAYTAQEVAQLAHIPGDEMAKTVIVKIDGKQAMVVLPAPDHVDFELLGGALGAKNVSLATEAEFMPQFSECEIGAMPPFGNLYHMDVYVEEVLSKDKKIAFNACSHNELIEMSYEDFASLVNPKVMRISTQYSSAVA
ncbi:MAG: YbaK/EbsC family protein [Gammaproteobacteria bacterium]|jgi:Ala-tRNA(Pro) deacylase